MKPAPLDYQRVDSAAEACALLARHGEDARILAGGQSLMAVLNTARAVLKDVETRKQVHIIKDELGKLGREFERFDKRMQNLAQKRMNIRAVGVREGFQAIRARSEEMAQRIEAFKQQRRHEPSATPGAADAGEAVETIVLASRN